MTWPLFALALLAASSTAAQAQFPTQERQDRRAALPTTPAEPVLELYVAAGNLTTVAFNGPLDRDSLVVDRTRFKWMDVGDRTLVLEPFTDLGPGERLIMQVGFKDRALPAKAVFAVTSKVDVMDGKVEVDRRANTPEALLAALSQKEAELEELKARYVGSGPASLVFSGWLTGDRSPKRLEVEASTGDTGVLKVRESFAYEKQNSALVVIRLRNLSGQLPWTLAQAHLTTPEGAPVKVLSAQMQPEQLAPGAEGTVVLELAALAWKDGTALRIELEDPGAQRRYAFKLMKK